MINPGDKFNRLTVIQYSRTAKNRDKYYECLCVCGIRKIVCSSKLKSGNTQSCGCLHREITSVVGKYSNLKHGHYVNRVATSTYAIWSSFIARCSNPKHPNYHYYGGRGIKVCRRWLEFKGFLSDMGIRPDGLTLDRLDNSKGYSKRNCKWVDRKTQGRNKRNNVILKYQNKSYVLAELAELKGIRYKTLWKRIRVFKWSVERAVNG